MLRQGRQRLGEPDEATTTSLIAVTDLDRLETMTDRLLHVPTWSELLQTP